ncbi:hypothetical protein OTU49_013216, partial [Cherax quadricarinatus]
ARMVRCVCFLVACAALLLLAVAAVSAQVQRQVSGVGGRVKIEVYFESLCPDSVHFFTHQLYPTWLDLRDIMDLVFVPFGKARATPTGTGDYEFECQHGPDECYGNKVMSCAQESLPIHTQMEFFHCMMSKPY